MIVLRERSSLPRAAWIIAAAALGALGAITATRFLGAPAEDRADRAPVAAIQAPPAPLALPPTNIVAPAPPVVTPSAPPAPSAVIVHFNDDQGVAITASTAPRAPAPARTAAPVAPRPAVERGTVGAPSGVAPATRPAPNHIPSIGPALPDGSFSLTRADVSPPLPEPARKRPLTAEQQLADAQLKASMK